LRTVRDLISSLTLAIRYELRIDDTIGTYFTNKPQEFTAYSYFRNQITSLSLKKNLQFILSII